MQIIVKRADSAPKFAKIIDDIVNPFTQINKKLYSLFSNQPTLLEDAYLAVDRVNSNIDYNVKVLSKLLDNNPHFIERYLINRFLQKDYISKIDDNHDYSLFWLRKDYLNIMKRITKVIFQYKEKNLYSSYYTVFFNQYRQSKADNTILKRQDKFLLAEISKKNTDKNFISLLFSVIGKFEDERRINFYKKFLELNKNLDDFKKLYFLPTSKAEVFSGSKEPLLQKKRDFHRKIHSICNSTELLEHKQCIENIINDINLEIERWRKTDFTEEPWPSTYS